MSVHTATKATRLLSEGRVRPVNESLAAFTVQGDSGLHHVALTCSCKAGRAGRVCSHLEAAFAWVTASPEDREIMEEILRLKLCACMGGLARCVPPFGTSGGCSRSDDQTAITPEQRVSGEAAL